MPSIGAVMVVRPRSTCSATRAACDSPIWAVAEAIEAWLAR
jgi:hypothetical protein